MTVTPDESVARAVTLMLKHDFSQLPVMQSFPSKEVKGLISWKSLGSRLATGNKCDYVRECMATDSHESIKTDQSILDAILLIETHDCVLVRDHVTKSVVGILTAYDISAQFRLLAEHFLRLEDIERGIRRILAERLSMEDLRTALKDSDPSRPPRVVNDVTELTFGDYVRVFGNQALWDHMKLKLDRRVFVQELDRMRVLRNKIMHFTPEGITAEESAEIQRCAKFFAAAGALHS